MAADEVRDYTPAVSEDARSQQPSMPGIHRQAVHRGIIIYSRSRLLAASRNRYEVTRIRLTFGVRAFSFSGHTAVRHTAWNSLTKELTDIPSTNAF